MLNAWELVMELFQKAPPVLVEVRFPCEGTSPDWYLFKVEDEFKQMLDRLGPTAELHVSSVWDLEDRKKPLCFKASACHCVAVIAPSPRQEKAATRSDPQVEIEQERQDRIDDLVAAEGPNWAEQFKLGSFGCHELLNRSLLTAEFVEETVLAHAACIQSPEWYALADKAVTALHELYQRVGGEHLTAEHDDEEK